jgi:hypothetical protein
MSGQPCNYLCRHLLPSCIGSIHTRGHQHTESQVLKNSDQEVTENEKQINTPGPQIPGILHMSLFHILFSPSTPRPNLLMSILKQDLINHAASLEWSLDLSWSTSAFLFF